MHESTIFKLFAYQVSHPQLCTSWRSFALWHSAHPSNEYMLELKFKKQSKDYAMTILLTDVAYSSW